MPFHYFTIIKPYIEYVLHLTSYAELVVPRYLMKDWSECTYFILAHKPDITDVNRYTLTYFYLFLTSDQWSTS